MRTVMDASMVAHVWAQQSQATARTPSSNFYFRDSTIYSYGSHFPAARIVKHKKKIAVLITTRTYSATTSGHLQLVRSAVRHMTRFYVSDVVGRNPHKAHLKDYRERIIDFAKSAKRSRSNKEWRLRELEALVDEANRYAKFFDLATRFTTPSDLDVAAEFEKAKRISERKKRKEERLKAERRAKALVELEKWKAGDSISTYQFSSLDEVFLRIKDDAVQTSMGAEVPLDHAVRILPFIRSGQAYKHNGHTIHIGHFRIDQIDEEGNLQAGCHLIKRSEIERIAVQLGL